MVLAFELPGRAKAMTPQDQFDAATWIADAFRAGIFLRVNASGDLSLDLSLIHI